MRVVMCGASLEARSEQKAESSSNVMASPLLDWGMRPSVLDAMEARRYYAAPPRPAG